MKLDRGGLALTVVVLCLIGAATLTPTPGTTVTTNPFCLRCGELASLDLTANIVMFMPLGFALVLATGRRRPSIVICVLVTVIVEALQIRLIAGRDASLRDIIANSLGGALGAQMAMSRDVLLRPKAPAATRLAVAWCGVITLVLALTAAGLRPARVASPLWVQWTPIRSNFEPFSGQLLGFDVEGIDLPMGQVRPSAGLDRALRGRSWMASSRISTRGLVPRRSVIARIADDATAIVSVEQLGRDLGCYLKTRSADFRFRSPKLALRDAFASNASETERLTCGRHGGTLSAGVEGMRDTLLLSPSLGWFLLSPFDVPITPKVSWVSALWLVALALPAGYWIALASIDATTRRRATLAGAFALAAVIGLTIAPVVAETSVASWWEWASAGLGALAGLLAARMVRTRSS